MARGRKTAQHAAYPRVIVQDDRSPEEPALSPAFHERNLSHFIGQRSAGGLWPEDPDDDQAVAHFHKGQKALYEDKDMVKAIRAYEAALDRAPLYLKAWVSLAIACISDNTPASLEHAEEVLQRLATLKSDDWLTREASSIIHQNLAYLHVHYYRNYAESRGERQSHLETADAEYAIADSLCQTERIECLCPWTYVKLERGQGEEARALWNRARACVAATGAPHILEEYAAKYAPLRALPSAC